MTLRLLTKPTQTPEPTSASQDAERLKRLVLELERAFHFSAPAEMRARRPAMLRAISQHVEMMEGKQP